MNVEIIEYQLPGQEWLLTDEERKAIESWIIENAPEEEGTWNCTNFGFNIVYRTTLS